MTWMEKFSKQSTILCSSHYTVHWIPSAISLGAQGVRQQTPHKWLCMPHLSTTSVGPTSGCVILVTVSGHCSSLLAIANFIHAYVVNLLKNKKGQQYLFLFNNFLNKILKHLTYIWYYTTRSLTITRHDKFESYSQVLEYIYHMPKLSNYPTSIGLPLQTCWASFWTCWASFWTCWASFWIGFTLVVAILIISLV